MAICADLWMEFRVGVGELSGRLEWEDFLELELRTSNFSNFFASLVVQNGIILINK